MSRKRRTKSKSKATPPDRKRAAPAEERFPLEFILLVAITAVMPLVANHLTTSDVGGNPLDGVTGLVWFGTLIVAAFALALLGAVRRGMLCVPRTGLWIGIGLVAVGTVVSASRAGDRYEALIGAVQVILGLLYLATVLLTVRGRRRCRWLLAALVAGAFASAAMSLYNHVTMSTDTMMAYYEEYRGSIVSPDDTMKDVMMKRRIEGDFISVFYHPNLMASYMALGLVVTVGLVIGHLRGTVHRTAPFDSGDPSPVRAASEHLASTWRQRPQSLTGSIMLAVCGAAMAVALMMTQGRAGVLAALAGVVVMLIMGFARTRRMKTILIAGLAALGIALAVTALRKGWFPGAAVSLQFRWQYWQGAWSTIAEQPWFGVGPNNFAGHYLGHKLAEAHEEIQHPHNALLWAWAECGLLAAIGLVTLIVFGFRDAAGRMAAVAEPPVPDSQMKRPLVLVAVICVLLVAAFAMADVGGANLIGVGMMVVLSMLSLSLPFLGVLMLGREADQALWNIGRRWIRIGLAGAAVAFWLQSMSSLSVPHLPTVCAAYAVLGLLVGTGRSRRDVQWPVSKRRRSTLAAVVAASGLLYVGLVVWPVIGSHWAMADAGHFGAESEQRRQYLRLAAERCPSWFEPHFALAIDQTRVSKREWVAHEHCDEDAEAITSDTPEKRQLAAQAEAHRAASRTACHRALQHLDVARKLSPRGVSMGVQGLGPWRLTVSVCKLLADRFGETERLAQAIEYQRQAVAIAPVSALFRAEYAVLLQEGGKTDEAGRQARKAIELEGVMTDEYRQLKTHSPELLARCEQIARKYGP